MSEKTYTILCSIYEPTVQALITRVLEPYGYRFIHVHHGKDAEKHVQEADLVLSDVSNGGYDLLDYVREHKNELPLIFLSGGTPEPERLNGARVLTKPFDLANLEMLVVASLS